MIRIPDLEFELYNKNLLKFSKLSMSDVESKLEFCQKKLFFENLLAKFYE